MEGLGRMGVGIILGDEQSHMVTRVQGLRNDLAVLSCPVTKVSRCTRPSGDRPAGLQRSLWG